MTRQAAALKPGAGRKDMARCKGTWEKADMALRHCGYYGHDYDRVAKYYGVAESTIRSYVRIAQIFPSGRRGVLTYSEGKHIDWWCRQPANVAFEPLMVAAKYQGQQEPRLGIRQFLHAYGKQVSAAAKSPAETSAQRVNCSICSALIGIQSGPTVTPTMCPTCATKVAKFIGSDFRIGDTA